MVVDGGDFILSFYFGSAIKTCAILTLDTTCVRQVPRSLLWKKFYAIFRAMRILSYAERCEYSLDSPCTTLGASYESFQLAQAHPDCSSYQKFFEALLFCSSQFLFILGMKSSSPLLFNYFNFRRWRNDNKLFAKILIWFVRLNEIVLFSF